MTTIIAGAFESKEHADRSIDRLLNEGIARSDIESISLSSPGQHDVESPSFTKSDLPSETNDDNLPPRQGAAGAATGAAIGGAVGLGLGVAATPFAGPAGPIAGAGVGAYVGSLMGALSGLEGEKSEAEIRRAGVLVAVRAEDYDIRERAERTLIAAGARQVEIAEGRWEDGHWADFAPETEPVVIATNQQRKDG